MRKFKESMVKRLTDNNHKFETECSPKEEKLQEMKDWIVAANNNEVQAIIDILSDPLILRHHGIK